MYLLHYTVILNFLFIFYWSKISILSVTFSISIVSLVTPSVVSYQTLLSPRLTEKFTEMLTSLFPPQHPLQLQSYEAVSVSFELSSAISLSSSSSRNSGKVTLPSSSSTGGTRLPSLFSLFSSSPGN